MGVVGICAQRQRTSQAIAAVITFYLIFHFLLFPSGQERFWGVFYIGCAMVLMIGAWHREAQATDNFSVEGGVQLPVEAQSKSELTVQHGG